MNVCESVTRYEKCVTRYGLLRNDYGYLHFFSEKSVISERTKTGNKKKRKFRNAPDITALPVDKSDLLGNMSGCGGLR